MNNLIIFILIFLLIHWFADFVMQNDYEVQNKSHSFKALLSHTGKYGIIMLAFGLGLIGGINGLIFGIVQFVTHTIIDYITSRINTKLWQEGNRHEFFVMIGFDQFIYQVILIGYLWILMK